MGKKKRREDTGEKTKERSGEEEGREEEAFSVGMSCQGTGLPNSTVPTFRHTSRP